jgi:hypothetical protein
MESREWQINREERKDRTTEAEGSADREIEIQRD